MSYRTVVTAQMQTELPICCHYVLVVAMDPLTSLFIKHAETALHTKLVVKRRIFDYLSHWKISSADF